MPAADVASSPRPARGRSAPRTARAQHAQAVVAEGPRIDRAQHARARADRARPSNGSRYSPVSGSQAIALTVKSRRRAASVERHDRIAGDLEAAVAAAGLRLAARQRDVDVGDLVDGEALADGVDRCRTRASTSRERGRLGRPKTSRSTSFDGVPEQSIADPAADDERAAAGVARRPRRSRDVDRRCSRARRSRGSGTARRGSAIAPPAVPAARAGR